MVLPETTTTTTQFQGSSPKKCTVLQKASSLIADGFLFVGGAFLAISLIWALLACINPNSNNPYGQQPTTKPLPSDAVKPSVADPSEPSTFYDDPSLGFTIDSPVKNWDEKRTEWLEKNKDKNSDEKVFLVSGSQPTACRNRVGDHLLLRLFKNKVDYCRIHGVEMFYNNVLLDPRMTSFWAKYAVVKAAMLSHPEADWIWWVDSDAVFTDMDFKLPLERYKEHNLVVHGWPHAIHVERSWTGLNAGVLLIRNCQWSMDLIDQWAQMGPQSPDYENWAKKQKSMLKDKLYPESDDQSGLIYLLLTDKQKWGDKIYLESDYNLEGYWLTMVDQLDDISKGYLEIEKRVGVLRKRVAEKMSQQYGEIREKYLSDGMTKRRPFVTHFTGCEPCTGDHNPTYTWEACWNGMQKALNFADNQVLRRYGFFHPDLLNSSLVSPLPFDFPINQ